MQRGYPNEYGSSIGGSSLSQIRSWAAQKQGVNPSLLASNQTNLSFIPSSTAYYPQYSNIDEAARRLEILTMQNRILKAQQQSLMIRKQMETVAIQQRNRIQAQQQAYNSVDNSFDDQRRFIGPPQQQSSQQRPPSQAPPNNAYARTPSFAKETPLINQPPTEQKASTDNANAEDVSLSSIPALQPPPPSQQSKEELPISPRKPTLLPSTHRKKLDDLSSDLNSIVEANATAIAKDKIQLLSSTDRNKQKHRDERKRVVDSIAQQSTSRVVTIMPRWRHSAAGNLNPAPETVMKPKSLFRAVVYGIITVIIVPERAIHHAKHQRKDKETRDFARSLRIFLESFSDWLSRPVTLPITSIVEDGSMDFEIKDWITNRSKFIPFKVRFKAILQGLSTASMPSTTITNFLVSFLADDNYFPGDFFWSCEQPLMQYNRLGGTRDVIPICETEEEILSLPGMTKKDVKQFTLPTEDEGDNMIANNSNPSVHYAGVLRLRMILIDVLFVRIVITKVILSPWQCKVCRQPVNRNVRRAVNNLRIMATIFYQLARKLNPLLPAPQPPVANVVSRSSAVDSAVSAKSPSSVKDNNANALKLPAISMKKNATADTKQANEEKASPGDAETASKDDENKTKAPPKAPKGVVASLLKVVGLADTTPGYEDFKKGTLEFQLLNEPAKYYDNTDFLFRFLLPDAAFVSPNLHAMLEDLLEESLPVLREWFDKLMIHILQAVIAKRIKQQQQKMVAEPISPRAGVAAVV